MQDTADLIDALTALAWPLIAGLALWRLLPVIEGIIKSRGFTVKVGAAELTVQEISDKLLRTTTDIQGKLASVSTSSPSTSDLESLPVPLLRRILWVDDNPSNNAYEAAQLEALGVEVVQVTSTREALTALSAPTPPFDAVLSDMGRDEDGTFHQDAGLKLAKALRARGDSVPVFIYSTATQTWKPDILTSGANGLATTSTALFELLRGVGEFPREAETA
ncbi:response regulator [Streptomyces sp. APSN-46.1]|uniref:response regulator n=1 Tax=Streptomyces sp. APSN-46.1 TaxID=2929049 RepID=UPI001FB1D19C|nr:response regulator [Streptomyces sp. APSN-46.1]MCJ1677633.1 response regulator [Streptomyces sp. APSN-46.1]